MSNDLDKLAALYESFDMVEDFLYTSSEKSFIEEIYSFPIKYPTLDKLDELRDTYLKEYATNADEIEKLIPFDEFIEYYGEMKDIFLYEEKKDPLSLPEYTDESLIENGFYQSEFVIHEHNATSLHWDLRWKTRFGNSAYSFAIPKAKMSDSENDRVLAIRQPMHPAIWVDLKQTDTFKEDTQRGAMGSIKLVDRGTIFVKERPRSFLLYLQGSIYKGGYILVHIGNNTSYILLRTEHILSDSDTRDQEWKMQAYKAYKYQTLKINEMFGLSCTDTKLVFENKDNSISLPDEDSDNSNAYQYIVIPNLNSEEIQARRKANPERIPEQCLNDAIASKLGNYIWNVKLDQDTQERCYAAIRRIDFSTPYLKVQDKVTDNDLFSEIFSCILTGRKMYKGTNLELIISPIIKNAKAKD